MLLVIAAAALAVRITAVAQPLGIDQGLWASAARGLSRGQLLYRDVWEQRPPGIYWVYRWAFELLGWRAATVAWLDVIASAITTALVFFIGRALSGRLTGAAAAALYAAFTMPAALYGHGGFLERAVSETFIVVCVAGLMLCAARWAATPSRAAAFGAGLLAGTTLVFKPNAGLYFPAALLWMALYGVGPGAASRRELLQGSVVAAAAAAILPLLTLLWLWRLDLLADARTAVVDFNRYYVGEGFDPAAYAVLFARAVWLRIKTEPVWLAGCMGAAVALVHLARSRRLPPLAGLTLIWGAAAVCVIVVNGARLFNSYFIQALPPLALLGAWLLVERAAASRVYRAVAVATGVLMAVLVLQRDIVGRVASQAALDLSVLRGTTDRMAYLERFGRYAQASGYSARANTELADYVRAHSDPDDRIFLFGINGATVYFEADRLSAHRFLRVNFFVETDFPDPAFRLDAVLADLARVRPRLLIFERLHVSSDSDMARRVDGLQADPDVRGLLAGYRRIAEIEDFTVYERLAPVARPAP